MTVSVSLEHVTEDGLAALSRLLELVAYDLSELSGANINENGLYVTHLDIQSWYEDPNHDLYFIRADDALAGFVVIKYLVEESSYYLNHFFILRKYRRQGVGRKAAVMAFDRYIGQWRVSQFDWNVPAQQFWRRVIQEYSSEPIVETRRADDKGPVQHLTNRIKHADGKLVHEQ
ncbi:GNAT family N-acetyltransferase [Paenibacillus sp. PR3]|uniref:GNAT family N-acetyltransferase n=1 Tax=Paenibacillus terricola TaxID=2763503 RepID=A0ABR8MU56_9BACL|nr:GNAT family N-acetyltransferase [Paenibacillus terricola]MBD3919496.1 GNAT family N-acetyltransferase [Paenibacillus terricola]